EELPPVLGVVVSMCPCLVLNLARLSVCALPGIEQFLVGLASAGPVDRQRQAHQLTFVERTRAWAVAHDRRVDRTRELRVEPDRYQLHLALTAEPGLVLDDLGVLDHRTHVGEGRQFLLGCRGARLGCLRGQGGENVSGQEPGAREKHGPEKDQPAYNTILSANMRADGSWEVCHRPAGRLPDCRWSDPDGRSC